jgi:hypothetical protein
MKDIGGVELPEFIAKLVADQGEEQEKAAPAKKEETPKA